MIVERVPGEAWQLQQPDAGLLNEQGIAAIRAHVQDDDRAGSLTGI